MDATCWVSREHFVEMNILSRKYNKISKNITYDKTYGENIVENIIKAPN